MKLGAIALVLVLACTVASAAPDKVWLDTSQLGTVPRAATGATRVAARAPRIPGVLAGADRDQEQVYRRLLDTFEVTVAKQRLPRNDVAVAAAILVIGAYTAYRGGELGDPAFHALVGQLRDLLAATPAFANASATDKRDMYETFAITGMLITLGTKAKPTDATMKQTGKTALVAMFGDAEAIRIGERGLVGGPASTAHADDLPAAGRTETLAAPVFPSANIVGIWWDTEMVYEAYPSNSMVMREDWHILLSDNTCTRGVPSTLVGWDPEALRAAKPKSWCTWRKAGNGYEVSWGKGWSSVKGTELRGFGRDERLDGTWSRQRTGTVGTASTWSGTTLALRRDGRFELSRHGHFTSSTAPRPGEVVVSGTGGKDRAGTYKLDDYLLELAFDSGIVEQHLFAANRSRQTGRLDGQVVFKKK